MRATKRVFAIVLALGLSYLAACTDSSGPSPSLANDLPSLIVSTPVHGTAPANADVSGTVAYVSLPPSSVPAGLRATIRDQMTGASVSATVIDGGFDPVSISASVGDTLLIDVTRSGGAGPVHGYQVVAAARPPTVVRTNPPRKKVDVPLNAVIVVVFSAPIDPATLSTASLQLLQSGAPAAGTVAPGDATGFRVEFRPTSLLTKTTEYELLITQGIRDVNGLALAEPVSVTFTTGSSEALAFASISVGSYHTCGVATTGAAYCWGANSYGELGIGTHTGPQLCFQGYAICSTVPMPVAGGLTFASVSAGLSYTCGVTTSGAAYCWGGATFYPQLGGGPQIQSDVPLAVAGGHTFTSVSAGIDHTCGVTTSGAAYCWGNGFYGALGTDSATFTANCPQGQSLYCDVPVPVAGGITFQAITVGYSLTCGVSTSFVAYCWGVNGWGQLGLGTNIGPEDCEGDPGNLDPATVDCSRTPVAVGGGLRVRAIAATVVGACALTTAGAAYCWGQPPLGIGTAGGPETCVIRTSVGNFPWPCSTRPVAVAGGLTYTALSAGDNPVCGVTASGSAYCWGDDLGTGALGNGGTGPRLVPTQVAGGLTFATISASRTYTASSNDIPSHSCGVTTDGVAYCWGAANFGQLGTGAGGAADSLVRALVPVKVAGQP